MGDIIDFLFGACLLSGIIFSVIGMPLHNTAKRKFLCELKPADGVNRSTGLRFYSFLLQRQNLPFTDRKTLIIVSVYRFYVLGFITCMALAILLLLFGFILRIAFPLAF